MPTKTLTISIAEIYNRFHRETRAPTEPFARIYRRHKAVESIEDILRLCRRVKAMANEAKMTDMSKALETLWPSINELI
jgi:hypothetical protein